ncbi:MAG TPA: fused MFS/spermidine synthase [Opitutaceae bacterium]|nr:fused MFS/spermidine synthase [Opitutaceae bacterium]
MSEPAAPAPSPAHRFLPLLLALFIGSGCSALIYEIVWFQLLQLVIGSSAVSLGILLGTFMGGMCLGSLLLPRLVGRQAHPLRVYALLEAGIGLIGIAVLFGVPLVDRFYTAHVNTGLAGIPWRGVVAALCLLPPTLLMGATLPAIARWVEATPRGVAWLGFFYGGNIAGAVFGCLLAGFYLLRVHDMATATYAAAALNGAVALIAFALAASAPAPAADEASATNEASSGTPAFGLVHAVIALSGLCALGAEVVWTRLLSLMLGATVYTFSIILAVFLFGLGIGSTVGSVVGRQSRQPRFALGMCQLLLTAAVAWTAHMISESLPYWPVDPGLSSNPWLNFQFDLVRCLWAVLPPACLWGASFPLALASVSAPGQDPSRLVSRVYASNTVGAIVGAVGFSVFVIAARGTQRAQQYLIAVSAFAALLAFIPLLWSRPAAGGRARFQAFPALGLLGAGCLACFLALGLPKIPWGVIAYGRYLPSWAGEIRSGGSKMLYVGEGMNSSVAVTELSSGVRNFHVSGKVEASSEPQDMRLQRMLGHIPALLHPRPRSVLVVGCGAGVTAGSFVLHPDVEHVTICEIEPLIPQVVAQYFGPQNYNVVHDPHVTVHYDDARHYVLTTPDKFDIITSDPIHPWVKGAATLYSKDYYELCKRHLNPGGIVTQWVPLYESNADAVKSEIATFFAVFPNGVIWSNDNSGVGYDLVLMGQVEPMKIDVDALQKRLDQPDYQRVAGSLNELGFGSAVALLSTYGGQASDLGPWMKDAEINQDSNLRLQYLAGLGLNALKGGSIYDEISAYRKFSDTLFVATGEKQEALRDALRPRDPKP